MSASEPTTRSLGAVYRKSIHPQEVQPPLKPAPDLGFESRVLDGGKVLFEKDYAIPMRDGITLYADVYRPISILKTPTIVLFAPFGKHGAVPREKFKNMDVDFSKLSKYTYWELPDPLLWCGEYGYSLISVDPRGTWWSEGSEANYLSPEEGRDGYDVVEWVARQEWSTGKVGWGAVSYYAMSIYQTAVLRPPHLAAIMPWEGISDLYREVNTVGGIPNVPFQHLWMDMTGNGLRESEDHAVASIEHPLYDEWWQSKVVDWSKIDVPAFSVTGWSSLGLHLRGTIEAWKYFSSKNKYLLIHAGREWSEYYKAENIHKQKLFWDRFLKSTPNEVDSWPPVQYDVRTNLTNFTRHTSLTFPPPSTLTTFTLSKNTLTPLNDLAAATKTPPASYQSYQSHRPTSSVSFSHTFQYRTEITGHAAAKLHIQCLHYPDTDLYLTLQKLVPMSPRHNNHQPQPQYQETKFHNRTQTASASAAHGWLRLSHRTLDPKASTPSLPIHLHQKRLWVRPCDVVEVQVELWPSSTVWERGEVMRLVVKGAGDEEGEDRTVVKGPRHGFGEVRVWFGEGFESGVVVPVVG